MTEGICGVVWGLAGDGGRDSCWRLLNIRSGAQWENGGKQTRQQKPSLVSAWTELSPAQPQLVYFTLNSMLQIEQQVPGGAPSCGSLGQHQVLCRQHQEHNLSSPVQVQVGCAASCWSVWGVSNTRYTGQLHVVTTQTKLTAKLNLLFSWTRMLLLVFFCVFFYPKSKSRSNSL